ncbi:MAG: Ig-like domain-containing protein [Gemmatimonadaceae bacterium]
MSALLRPLARRPRRRLQVLILCGLVACGGGGSDGSTNPPPPDNTVATVTVSPGTSGLTEGDSVDLTATPKNAAGSSIGGKSVTWSSSATAVASVSSSGRVTAVQVGAATITATVDGKSGTAQITVSAGPIITLDAAKAASTSIGSLGGSVTTSTNDGSKYVLTVPGGSMTTAATIRLTPMINQRQLPAGGSFVAGVKLEPAGLVFPRPATLMVVHHFTPDAAKRLVGYLAGDDGTLVELATATRHGDTLWLRVPHFSTAGWGQFVPPQVAALPATFPPTGVSAQFRSQISALVGSPVSAYASVFAQWFTQGVNPQLTAVPTNGAVQDAQAAFDYDEWEDVLQLVESVENFNGALLTALTTDRMVGQQGLKLALQNGITLFNGICAAASGFTTANTVRVFTLQDLAHKYSLDTPANGLDTPSVLRNLCLHVENTVANYPVAPVPNQPAQLDLRYGVRVGTQVSLGNTQFQIGLTLAGSTTDGFQLLQTDNLGQISGAVTPTGQSTLTADVQACIHPGVGYRLDEVCLQHTPVQRSFGRTINADVVVGSQAGLAQLAGVSRINGNLIVGGGSATPSTDLNELSQLTTVTGTVLITNLPQLTALTGLRNLTQVGGSVSISNHPQLRDISALHLTNVPNTLTLDLLPQLTDLSALARIAQVGGLNLFRMPQITSLAALGGTTYGNLSILGMNGLTTLSDLHTPAAAFPGSLSITSNTKLFDFSLFKGVTSIGGDLRIFGNPVLAAFSDLSALQRVDGSLNLGGNAVTSIGGLSHLTQVGKDFALNVNELDGLSSFQLPALASVGGSLQLNQARSTGAAPGTLTVSFPALSTLGGNITGQTSASAGIPPRTYDLTLGSLQNVGGIGAFFSVDLADGLRNLVLGPVHTAQGGTFSIDNNDQLRTITLGATIVGGNLEIDNNDALQTVVLGTTNVTESIEIDHNLALTSVQFGGGFVGQNVEIDNNVALTTLAGTLAIVSQNVEIHHNAHLSTQAATAWANGIGVGGQVQIHDNAIP